MSQAKNFKLAYTINEFIEAAGIGRSMTYREIREGRLRAVKVGKRTLIRRRDAEAWLEGLPVVGADQEINE